MIFFDSFSAPCSRCGRLLLVRGPEYGTVRYSIRRDKINFYILYTMTAFTWVFTSDKGEGFAMWRYMQLCTSVRVCAR